MAESKKGGTDIKAQFEQDQAQAVGKKKAGAALTALGVIAEDGGVAGLATVAGIFTAGIGASIILGIAAATAGGAAGAGTAAGGLALGKKGDKSRNESEVAIKNYSMILDIAITLKVISKWQSSLEITTLLRGHLNSYIVADLSTVHEYIKKTT